MVGIYVVGASLIVHADAGSRLGIFSDMVVYTSYAAILIQAFMDMNMAFNQYPRAAVSAERILQVLDRDTAVKDGSGASLQGSGRLEFRHVSFAYPGGREDVLHDISFTAEPGTTTAIIGATGSGKSTLVRLIPRLYDADSGEVLLDGAEVRKMKLADLHDRIGYASQRAILLTGTVRSNVEYGDNGRGKPGEAGVRKALEIAQAASFVSEMDGDIDAVISRGGTNVSGGQKQRLSIARSIAWKPEIYVFDDSFSALDYETDRALRQALKQETAGITTILVAQRIGTIRDADRILVLDRGRIVGEGTHQQLLKSCSVYQEIARTQLSREELA
jgi:ATP-binding cassette subfamily B protein